MKHLDFLFGCLFCFLLFFLCNSYVCSNRLTLFDECLPSEAVQGAALALECVDNIKGSHSLSAGVLSVGDSVSDDVLKEHFQNTSGLLVDEAWDALDTTSACETSDGGLGNALDVVTKDLSVALCPSLS